MTSTILLTVIRGNASLAMEGVDPSHPLFMELTNIEQAAARATDLTRQLLAFGRKQVLLPQPLDINAIVAQLTRLLERVVPSSIAVRLTPAAETGLIKTDRGTVGAGDSEPRDQRARCDAGWWITGSANQ